MTFIDSYDHLPTEVAAALAAARSGPWGRVVCCFQPHRYSRTEALWASFADAFVEADLLCVTDVYGAGEAVRPGVRGKLVVDAVLDAHPWAQVAWLPTLDDVVGYLGARLRPGDLCLTLGAGDLTTVPDRVLATLAGGEGMSEPAVIEEAARLLGERAARDVPLGPRTTYRVGGAAALLVNIDDDADVEAVCRAVSTTGVDVLVVGKGSNLLVADAGFAGAGDHAGRGSWRAWTSTAQRCVLAPPPHSRSSPGARLRPDSAASSGASAYPARWAERSG